MLFLECTWFIAWIEPNTTNIPIKCDKPFEIYISGFTGVSTGATLCRQCSLCKKGKMIIYYANDEIRPRFT